MTLIAEIRNPVLRHIVSHAARDHHRRFAIGGVLVRAMPNGTVTLAATDGIGMAVYSAPTTTEVEKQTDIIIPIDAIKRVKADKRGVVAVTVSSDEGYSLHTKPVQIDFDPLEGAFPPFEGVIPAIDDNAEQHPVVGFNPKYMRNAFDLIAKVADDDPTVALRTTKSNKPARLDWSDGEGEYITVVLMPRKVEGIPEHQTF